MINTMLSSHGIFNSHIYFFEFKFLNYLIRFSNDYQNHFIFIKTIDYLNGPF